MYRYFLPYCRISVKKFLVEFLSPSWLNLNFKGLWSTGMLCKYHTARFGRFNITFSSPYKTLYQNFLTFGNMTVFRIEGFL